MLLIYDGDCGFCTSVANWFAERAGDSSRIAPWQSLELAAFGLTAEEAGAAVYWHDVGQLRRGADACAAAMKSVPSRWRITGHLLALPGVIQLARLAYPVIAKNRYRLPGSTDACRL